MPVVPVVPVPVPVPLSPAPAIAAITAAASAVPTRGPAVTPFTAAPTAPAPAGPGAPPAAGTPPFGGLLTGGGFPAGGFPAGCCEYAGPANSAAEIRQTMHPLAVMSASLGDVARVRSRRDRPAPAIVVPSEQNRARIEIAAMIRCFFVASRQLAALENSEAIGKAAVPSSVTGDAHFKRKVSA